jgi:hypothetical protein
MTYAPQALCALGALFVSVYLSVAFIWVIQRKHAIAPARRLQHRAPS